MKLPVFFIIAFAAFFSLAVPASAADFSLIITQPETIYAGNTTNFSAIVTNTGPDDWFSISPIGTYSSWITIDKQNVFIPSGSSALFALRVVPAYDALQNKYQYSIIASRAGTGLMVEKDVFVNVLQSSSVIIKDFSASCSECMPGEMVAVSASLKNIGSRPLGSMKLIFAFGDRTKVMPVATLDFGAVKIFTTDFSLDEVSAPGKYQMEAKLMQDTSVLAQKSVGFAIPLVSNIKTVKNVSSSIFGNYNALVSTNYGNAEQTAEIKSDVLNAWYSVYSGAKPSSINPPVYGWAVSLAPKESVTITYSEIFWPVPLALVSLVFAGAYYYIILSSLLIRKRIIRRPNKEVSVSLDVRSGLHSVDNAVVRDAIPKGFEVSGKFESIKPVIRKLSSGTELVWRLGRLKPNEERILHYRIKPIAAFGTVRFHPAELNGKRGSKLVSRMSNFAVLHEEAGEPQKRIKVVVRE